MSSVGLAGACAVAAAFLFALVLWLSRVAKGTVSNHYNSPTANQIFYLIAMAVVAGTTSECMLNA